MCSLARRERPSRSGSRIDRERGGSASAPRSLSVSPSVRCAVPFRFASSPSSDARSIVVVVLGTRAAAAAFHPPPLRGGWYLQSRRRQQLPALDDHEEPQYLQLDQQDPREDVGLSDSEEVGALPHVVVAVFVSVFAVVVFSVLLGVAAADVPRRKPRLGEVAVVVVRRGEAVDCGLPGPSLVGILEPDRSVDLPGDGRDRISEQ
mmetsp:Transcript_23365/g.55311  ORF Transcript_23365/g.55311 Transcript_23365/m.55311 type:complete len:205 (-) Transcript_23365:1845-2459(-)